MLKKSLLLAGLFFVFLFFAPRTISAQSIINNCNTGYEPKVAGSSCVCESKASPGTCSNVDGSGEGCNSGYIPQVFGTDTTDCRCIEATSPGTCSTGSTTPTGTGGTGTTRNESKGPAIDFGVLQQNLNQTGYNPQLDTLGGIVSAFVPYVFGLAGIVLFLYFIWGGFGIMMSRGDPKATAAGKDRITRAVVGFAIIFSAFWIVQILGLILGISQFRNLF